jgi:hypothetical protein
MSKENTKILGSLFILIILISSSIVGIARGCGDLIVSATNKTDSSILWSWNINQNITRISIDGSLISNFDNSTNMYILNDLKPSSLHYINIFNNEDSGCNTTTTNIATQSESEKLAGNANLYFLFFIALACLIIGLFIPFIALVSIVIYIIGLIGAFNHSLLMGLIFFAGLIASIYIGIVKSEV